MKHDHGLLIIDLSDHEDETLRKIDLSLKIKLLFSRDCCQHRKFWFVLHEKQNVGRTTDALILIIRRKK